MEVRLESDLDCSSQRILNWSPKKWTLIAQLVLEKQLERTLEQWLKHFWSKLEIKKGRKYNLFSNLPMKGRIAKQNFLILAFHTGQIYRTSIGQNTWNHWL